MATGATYEAEQARRLHAGQRRCANRCGRRGRLHHRRHQGAAGRQGGRHRHLEKKLPDKPARPRRRCPASRKSSRRCSPGSIRSRPTSTTRLRDALEKLKLNDASLHYEPETSPGAGLRLPLRLPRPAAHGDRAGAAGARIRPGPHHHRAERGLPGAAARRRGARRSRTRRRCPTRPDRGDARADRHGDLTCRRSTSAR